VHARVFLKDLKVGGSSGRVRPSNPLKGSTGSLCRGVLKKRRKFARRWMSSAEEHLVILQISQGRKGRSVFSKEDSRHSVSRQISQRCRGDTVGIFQGLKSQEG
jgi:hypothetical protein